MEATAINQPHPDDAEEDFFGEPPSEDPTPVEGLPTLSDEQRAAEAAAYREEKGEPEPAPASEAASTPEDADEGPAPDDPPAPTRGAPERLYRVFQRVPLTDRVLRHMLEEIEAGRAPEPRVAFIETHHVEAKNDRQAIVETYKEHKDRLGPKCDLAAVSARSFKERHVEPRQVVAENISIT